MRFLLLPFLIATDFILLLLLLDLDLDLMVAGCFLQTTWSSFLLCDAAASLADILSNVALSWASS